MISIDWYLPRNCFVCSFGPQEKVCKDNKNSKLNLRGTVGDSYKTSVDNWKQLENLKNVKLHAVAGSLGIVQGE